MSGAPIGREQGRGELETARALNTVATIGAGHALYTSLPEATRAKMGAAVVRRAPRKVVAAASRARRKVSLPKNAGKKAVIATTGAWLGFHGAELAGDIMARRSINNQIRKLPAKEETAKSLPRALRRKSLSEAQKMPKYALRRIMAHGDGQEAGVSIARAIRHQRAGNQASAKFWVDDAGERIAMGSAHKQPQWFETSKSFEQPVDFSKAANRGSGHGENLLSKRYFDPEADRQRRIGLYAGLGGGSALVLGDAARRQFTGNVERHPVQGKQKRGRLKRVEVGLKQGKRLRTPALLGGAAALSAIGGAAAYKHGISERNRPYS